MKKKAHIKQIAVQNKKQKIVILGKASDLTLGKQGSLSEGVGRTPRSW